MVYIQQNFNAAMIMQKNAVMKEGHSQWEDSGSVPGQTCQQPALQVQI